MKTQLTLFTPTSSSRTSCTAGGEYRSLEWHASVDQEGLVHAAARDITEKLESERKRKKSEQRYLLALENTDAGVWDWDLRANTVTFGVRWKSMLGYAETEVEDSFEGWRSLWHPDDAHRIQQAMDANPRRHSLR